MSRSTNLPAGRAARPRPPRGTARRRLAALLLAAAAAAPAPGGEAPSRGPDATPRFFLESIAVEGVRRASAAVIVSETLLAEGHSYTETELRQAVYRVQRLPFVLDAGFSLSRGGERGHYRLLIAVEEVHSFFFGADLIYQDVGDSLSAGTRLADDTTEALSAGVRFFAGHGVFFAAVADLGDLQLGYERYRLLDRPLFLRLAFSQQTTCCSVQLHELGLDPAAGTWTTDASERAELTVGLLLGDNHSLRLDAARLEAGDAFRLPFGAAPGPALDARGLERRELELAWVWDTTDDPVFPTRGDAVTAAVGLKRFEASLVDGFGAAGRGTAGPGAAPPLALARMSSRLVGLSLFGAHHWPLTARQTVSLSLKLLASRSEVDGVPVGLADEVQVGPADAIRGRDGNGGVRFAGGDVDVFEADFEARYSVALGGRWPRRGELRWETVASVLYVETSPVFEPASHPLWGLSASTTLALRNGWGIFRLGFAIFDFDGDL